MPSSARKSLGDIKSPNGDGQAPARPYSDFAERLRSEATKKGFISSTLAAALGVTRGTMARYWDGDRLPPSDTLITLSETLDVSPTWLIRGAAPNAGLVIGVDDAEWVKVPEYDLRELTDNSRGPLISTTPIRRDWLSRTLNRSSGLWLARLPADLPSLDLREGDLVFLRDVEAGEAQDGAIYIVRIWGHLTVARIDLLASERGHGGMSPYERIVGLRDIGSDDGQAILVARVLGAPLRKL